MEANPLHIKTYLLLSLLPVLSLASIEPSLDHTPIQQNILSLSHTNQIRESIALYRSYTTTVGHHDFTLLQQMVTAWVENSARSTDVAKKASGLFALSLGGIIPPKDILEQSILSPSAQIQQAALILIDLIQEDHADALLNKAMASDYLDIRLQAAFYLIRRKSLSAIGQIESLMYRLPPFTWSHFAELYAMLDTKEAVHALRQLMDEKFSPTKVSAILQAAQYHREELLPKIRSALSHLHPEEQEACVCALGYLEDIRSLKKIEKLAQNDNTCIRLAAALSLYRMGYITYKKPIIEEAQKGNPFAIPLLSDIEDTQELLLSLTRHASIDVRFNAAYTLLRKKDPRSLPPLIEFLCKDSRDWGFYPCSSPGGALRYLHVVSSSTEHQKHDIPFDITSYTMTVQSHILHDAAALPEEDFLWLVNTLLEKKEQSLLPQTIFLLEQLHTRNTITLLDKYSQKVGAPFLRGYCNLALYRMQEKGPYEERIKDFLRCNTSKARVHLHDPLPFSLHITDSYHLTPDEKVQLILDSYSALFDRQNIEAIDILLDALPSIHLDDQAVFAALLLQALK